MSRRNIKPTTFHDDSRSSDAGSVIAAPTRSKPRTIKDPSKDLPPSQRDNRTVAEAPLNGIPTSAAKLPPLGPDGEIQVDFSAFPVEALQKYKHHYELSGAEGGPPAKKTKTAGGGAGGQGKKRGGGGHEESDEEMSNSEDESPYRIDLGAWRPRINKTELARIARAHFSNLPPARENDTIVQFLYAVKTQDKVLKLRPD